MGGDASTVEANAALRSIVWRDSGQTYQQFLDGLPTEPLAAPAHHDYRELVVVDLRAASLPRAE